MIFIPILLTAALLILAVRQRPGVTSALIVVLAVLAVLAIVVMWIAWSFLTRAMQ